MKITKKQIKEVTTHIINGLHTGGGHHKQWDLEQALIALRGQKWVDKYKKDHKEIDGDVEYDCWKEGIPA